MEAPGGEGIAEGPPHGQRGDQRPRHSTSPVTAKLPVVSSARKSSSAAADDRDAEGAHADQGERRLRAASRASQRPAPAKNLPTSAPMNSEAKNRPPRNPSRPRPRRPATLSTISSSSTGRAGASSEGQVQRAVARPTAPAGERSASPPTTARQHQRAARRGDGAGAQRLGRATPRISRMPSRPQSTPSSARAA